MREGGTNLSRLAPPPPAYFPDTGRAWFEATKTVSQYRTVASSLEVVRPYCIVITTTPTFAHSLVQVSHKCGTAMAVPAATGLSVATSKADPKGTGGNPSESATAASTVRVSSGNSVGIPCWEDHVAMVSSRGRVREGNV